MSAVLEAGPEEVGHGGKCNSLLRQQPPAGGKRCAKTAGWGTEHQGVGACKLHGGSTSTHVEKAKRLKLARSIAELVELHRPDLAAVDPHDALLEVVADSWAMRRALWGLVGDLIPRGGHAYRELDDVDGAETGDGRALVEYVPAEEAGLWGPDTKGEARPHVLVGMLHEATRDHLQACKYAIEAGIDERRLRLAEGQVEELADFMRLFVAGVLAALVAAGVKQAQVKDLEGRLPQLMRRSLEELRGGAIDVQATETKES